MEVDEVVSQPSSITFIASNDERLNNNSGSETSCDESDGEAEQQPKTIKLRRNTARPLPPLSALNSPLAILAHFTRCVLDAWSGYQVGIEQKSAGSQTQEKDEWFKEEIVKLLVKPSRLEVEDLVEWLDDILSEDFNLLLEDGSTVRAARALLQLRDVVRDRLVSAKPAVAARDLLLQELKTFVDKLNF